MHRRQFLALGGAVVSAAGCQSRSDGSVTPVPDAAIESTATDEPTDVAVERAAVQPGVVGPDSPDSIGVFDADGQHLLLTVSVRGGRAIERSAFRFHFDGASYTPTELRNGLYRGEWGVRYVDGAGPLIFDLAERGDPAGARLTWPGGEWTPPEPVRTRLAAPLPTFDASLDGPTTVTEADDPTITVSVRNTGDVPGQVALALNRTGPRIAYAPVTRIVADLDPGERASREHDAKSPYVTEGEPREAVYRLDAPGSDEGARHAIRPATGTATQ